jgi:hypothetical protein
MESYAAWLKEIGRVQKPVTRWKKDVLYKDLKIEIEWVV